MIKKMKPPIQRIPKERVSTEQIIREVSHLTGYTIKDIREVLFTTIEVIKQHVLLKRLVVIGTLGRIYPYIWRGRTVQRMNGGVKHTKPMKQPSKWIVKFLPHQSILDDAGGLEVSRKEERDLLL